MIFGNVLKAATGEKVGRIEKLWSFDAKNPITTSPVVGNINGKNVIAFGTKNGTLVLLNENAELLWIYSPQDQISDVDALFQDTEKATSIYCDPIIADIDGKKILFGTETGRLFALNPDGKLLWEFKAKDKIRSQPIAVDITNNGKNEIIFGSSDRNLYALDGNGKLIWQSSTDSGIEAGAAVEDNKIIFGSDDGTVYALDFDGHLLWRYKTKGKITAKPIISDISGDGKKSIIIGSDDKRLYVLDMEGKLRWSYETEGRIANSVAIADLNGDGKKEIIFGSADDKAYALTCDGSKIWHYETDFWIVTSPIVNDIDHDDKAEVIIGSYDHSLYFLDGQGRFSIDYAPGVSSITQQAGSYSDIMTSQPGNYAGKKLWQFKTEGMIIGMSMMINERKDKVLIVATDNGKIEAFVHKKR